jgi:hypothetical protein
VSFLNPLFLFGLAAASIPVIIHLFTRRQPREVRFPSLEFLSEVNQSEIRRVRIKQWLLLLLRILAVAAIALAMARPALEGSAGGRSGAATTVVALVDRSGSMDAAGQSGTLSAQARRMVEDLLSTLGPSDALLLVPYDRAPHPVTPRPSSDLGRLRAAAQALGATSSTTDHRAALETAARALAESRALNRELFWISDFQSSGFSRGGFAAAPPGPWAQTRVYLVPLSPRSRANAALSDASLAPTESGVALSVTASSFGAGAGDLAVEATDAVTHDPLGRGFVSLASHGDASTLLPLARLPEQGGVAALPDDALPLDNKRVFAAGRSGTLQVLVREDAGPSALRLALEAGSPASGLAVEAVDGASLPARLRDAAVLVINDVERLGASELQAVLDFVRAGGGVLVVLGPRADAAFWNASLLREIGAGTLGPPEQAAPGAAWRLVRAVAGHAVLAGFPTRPGEPLSTARFERIRVLQAGPGARELLEFDRARPALIEAGSTLVFAAGLDPQSSDFPMSGAFLPLLHQAVKVLGRGTAAGSLVPGDRYTAPASTGAWRIEDLSGREVPSELVTGTGSTRLRSAPLEQPGLYRVLQGGTLRTTFGTRADARARVPIRPRADRAPRRRPRAARARGALRPRAVVVVRDPGAGAACRREHPRPLGNDHPGPAIFRQLNFCPLGSSRDRLLPMSPV